MERFILKELLAWKNSKWRKPLILHGARQVGKTYIMKEFGKRYFNNVVYFNFDGRADLKTIFQSSKEPKILLDKLSLLTNEKIVPQKTLIIFDEIQECPNALNSLKYFNEDAPEYAIISAGSLLGIYLNSEPHPYPVGQVSLIPLYPLNFEEFLLATNETLYNSYCDATKEIDNINVLHNRLTDAYKYYLSIGGLPAAVKSWADNRDPKAVTTVHKELTTLYEQDIAKHHGSVNPARILMVWRNIVTQLAKENKKFVYGLVKSGARAREFEEAIEWLVTAGLINRVYNVTKNTYSLKTFEDMSAFKLYLFDTGLLKYMAELTNESIILDSDFQFKGALTENYVLQQSKTTFEKPLHYYTFDRYEIDFLLQHKEQIIPIEVKASQNTNSSSSAAYKKRFHPPLYIRYSQLNLKHDEQTLNIPLYLVCKTSELL